MAVNGDGDGDDHGDEEGGGEADDGDPSLGACGFRGGVHGHVAVASRGAHVARERRRRGSFSLLIISPPRKGL